VKDKVSDIQISIQNDLNGLELLSQTEVDEKGQRAKLSLEVKRKSIILLQEVD
jgi:hypothetical protein